MLFLSCAQQRTRPTARLRVRLVTGRTHPAPGGVGPQGDRERIGYRHGHEAGGAAGHGACARSASRSTTTARGLVRSRLPDGELQQSGQDDEHGRGLFIVAASCDHCGDPLREVRPPLLGRHARHVHGLGIGAVIASVTGLLGARPVDQVRRDDDREVAAPASGPPRPVPTSPACCAARTWAPNNSQATGPPASAGTAARPAGSARIAGLGLGRAPQPSSASGLRREAPRAMGCRRHR